MVSPVPTPPAPFANMANGSFASIAHSRRDAARNGDSKAARAKEKPVQPAPAERDATETWWVQAKGAAYGPYTRAQLERFVGEGRVRAATLISTRRDGGWREAQRAPEFAGLFAAPAPAPAAGFAPGKAGEPANLFVFTEIHSGAWMQFMAALEAMGRVAELAPGFWLLRTRLSSGAVRNALSQTLASGDRFVVVDATRDRLAWFNMGPGPEVAIREVWNGDLDKRG